MVSKIEVEACIMLRGQLREPEVGVYDIADA
jgi:hypothetical protein